MASGQQLQLEFAQRDISFQYAQLCLASNCPTGIYVQLDDDDTHCESSSLPASFLFWL